MTAQMAQQYRYDVTQGVFVCSVEPGSAAEKAGLQMGDVITKIGDTAISDMNDLNAAKKSYRAGDTVTLTIYRAGGTKEVELTFDAVPQTQETAQDSSSSNSRAAATAAITTIPGISSIASSATATTAAAIPARAATQPEQNSIRHTGAALRAALPRFAAQK